MNSYIPCDLLAYYHSSALTPKSKVTNSADCTTVHHSRPTTKPLKRTNSSLTRYSHRQSTEQKVALWSESECPYMKMEIRWKMTWRHPIGGIIENKRTTEVILGLFEL